MIFGLFSLLSLVSLGKIGRQSSLSKGFYRTNKKKAKENKKNITFATSKKQKKNHKKNTFASSPCPIEFLGSMNLVANRTGMANAKGKGLSKKKCSQNNM